jgi:hypothetical protein
MRAIVLRCAKIYQFESFLWCADLAPGLTRLYLSYPRYPVNLKCPGKPRLLDFLMNTPAWIHVDPRITNPFRPRFSSVTNGVFPVTWGSGNMNCASYGIMASPQSFISFSRNVVWRYWFVFTYRCYHCFNGFSTNREGLTWVSAPYLRNSALTAEYRRINRTEKSWPLLSNQ